MLSPDDTWAYRYVRFLKPKLKQNENHKPLIILFVCVPSFIISLKIGKFPKFVCVKRPYSKLLVRQSLNINGSHGMGWKGQMRALEIKK